MPLVENAQQLAELQWGFTRSLSSRERFDRTFAMFGSMYQAIAHRLRKKYPEMSDRQIRIEIAKRLYGNDIQTMELIEKCEKQ